MPVEKYQCNVNKKGQQSIVDTAIDTFLRKYRRYRYIKSIVDNIDTDIDIRYYQPWLKEHPGTPSDWYTNVSVATSGDGVSVSLQAVIIAFWRSSWAIRQTAAAAAAAEFQWTNIVWWTKLRFYIASHSTKWTSFRRCSFQPISVNSTEKIKIKSQKKKAHNKKPRLNTQIYTSWMIFLMPNQQCQSTECTAIQYCVKYMSYMYWLDSP